MASYTLYNDVYDPVAQSMLLVLTANQIPHKTVPVNGEKEGVSLQNNGKFVATNYPAVIKALENDVIQTSDPEMKEKHLKMIKHFTEDIQPLFLRTVMTGNPREGLDLFFEGLAYFENQLILSPGPYFGGKTPNMLDYGLYPWLEKIGSWIPDINKHECVSLQSWVKRMRNDPVVLKVMPTCDSTSLETYKHTLSTKMQKCA